MASSTYTMPYHPPPSPPSELTLVPEHSRHLNDFIHSPDTPPSAGGPASSPPPASGVGRVRSRESSSSDERTGGDSDLPPAKRWKESTGHRRGLAPEKMLPLDAPTKPRRNLKGTSPSANTMATSPGISPPGRAAVHSTVAPAAAAAGITPPPALPPTLPQGSYDVHGIWLPGVRPNLPPPISASHGASPQEGYASDEGQETDLAAIKRRQNTIAARRSRQRKLEHVRNLEDQVKSLTDERDGLKGYVQRLEDRVALLKDMIVRVGGNETLASMASLLSAPVDATHSAGPTLPSPIPPIQVLPPDASSPSNGAAPSTT